MTRTSPSQAGEREGRSGDRIGLTGAGAADAPVEEVVAAAAAGAEWAWRELLARYARRVYAMAQSRLHNPELAEEIAQSVFATVAEKLPAGGYDERGRFEPWLFRVTMNRVRDEARRRQRSPVVQVTEHHETAANNGANNGSAQGLEHANETRKLRAAIDQLGDADREVIEMRHHGQMSFNQMADALGEPVGTLLARHHRALKKLRALLEGATPAEGAS